MYSHKSVVYMPIQIQAAAYKAAAMVVIDAAPTKNDKWLLFSRVNVACPNSRRNRRILSHWHDQERNSRAKSSRLLVCVSAMAPPALMSKRNRSSIAVTILRHTSLMTILAGIKNTRIRSAPPARDRGLKTREIGLVVRLRMFRSTRSNWKWASMVTSSIWRRHKKWLVPHPPKWLGKVSRVAPLFKRNRAMSRSTRSRQSPPPKCWPNTRRTQTICRWPQTVGGQTSLLSSPVQWCWWARFKGLPRLTSTHNCRTCQRTYNPWSPRTPCRSNQCLMSSKKEDSHQTLTRFSLRTH